MKIRAVPKSDRIIIVLVIVVFIFFWLYGYFKKQCIDSNAGVINGEVVRVFKGIKGSRYIEFGYNVDMNYYTTSVPFGDCEDCEIGDTVVIKYNLVYPDRGYFMSKK